MRTDEDVERGLEWFLQFLKPSEWRSRRELILRSIGAGDNRTSTPVGSSGLQDLETDRIGFYLCLAEAYLNRGGTYDHAMGARVIPTFKRIGMHVDLLENIGDADVRTQKLLREGRTSPDSALFELLVAILYARNGCSKVDFINEDPPNRTPDLSVTHNASTWQIECKRLSGNSQYSEHEQAAWDRMWKPLEAAIVERDLCVTLDLVFHTEVSALPEDVLINEIPDRLRLTTLPGRVFSDERLTVHAKHVDRGRFDRHLARWYVRDPSPQLDELVVGRRDLNRKLSTKVVGDHKIVENVSCLSAVDFACGAVWHSDSPNVISRKARDIRSHLSKACTQFRSPGPCAIHVGLETSDGHNVERERFRRVYQTALGFDAGDVDLRFFVLHLYHYDAPPDTDWQVDETPHPFRAPGNSTLPLKTLATILDDDAPSPSDSIHWTPIRVA